MTTGAFAATQAASLPFQPMMYMPEYLAQLEGEGRSSTYVRTTKNGLTHFADYLRGRSVFSPEAIERMHILDFQSACNERVQSGEWKKSTAIQTLKKVRAWINWLFDLEYITSMPWMRIKLGTVPKEPKPLEDHELKALFATHNQSAFTMDPFQFHRREIILTLFFMWGLRLNELAALTIHQLDVRNDFAVVVNSKTGGTKTMPMTPEVKAALGRWFSQRAKYSTPEVSNLLITRNGTGLSDTQIRTIISDLGKDAGVPIHPSRFRDTCATELLGGDVDPTRVQKVLGHSKLSMTMSYARVNDQNVYRDVTAVMDKRIRGLFRHTGDLRDDSSL